MASATGKPIGFLWVHVWGFIKLARKNLVGIFFFAARIAHVGYLPTHRVNPSVESSFSRPGAARAACASAGPAAAPGHGEPAGRLRLLRGAGAIGSELRRCMGSSCGDCAGGRRGPSLLASGIYIYIYRYRYRYRYVYIYTH